MNGFSHCCCCCCCCCGATPRRPRGRGWPRTSAEIEKGLALEKLEAAFEGLKSKDGDKEVEELLVVQNCTDLSELEANL